MNLFIEKDALHPPIIVQYVPIEEALKTKSSSSVVLASTNETVPRLVNKKSGK